MIFFGILVGFLLCSILLQIIYETTLGGDFESFIKIVIFSSLFSVISYYVAIYSTASNKESQKTQPKVTETEL